MGPGPHPPLVLLRELRGEARENRRLAPEAVLKALASRAVLEEPSRR
ncbi:MAG: hypothetical protein VKK97_01135 [Synechococcaceae cyanobacterium]|nr:hypothetical protein [Synechococcaceae cyanobacterium]